MGHPIRQNDPLAMPDVTLSLETKPREEPLIGSGVGNQIIQAIDQAESIAKPDVVRRHAREGFPARKWIQHRPRIEPAVDGLGDRAVLGERSLVILFLLLPHLVGSSSDIVRHTS